MIVVPSGSAVSLMSGFFPPATSMRVPVKSPTFFVSRVKRETLAIAGIASPRKPRVAIDSKSLTSMSLLVACRSKARMASSWLIPQPLSLTWMSRLPPCSTLICNFFAPASSEFSRSSLATETGRSTTSPAAILFATTSERMRIRPISQGIW